MACHPETPATPETALLTTPSLARGPGVVVAFSGGVDSAVVLAAALRARADRPGSVVAAIADSPSLARAELADAVKVASALGVELVVVPTDELASAGYRANAGDRCYFCKSTVLTALTDLAVRRELGVVVTGTHLDDRAAPHRPGLRAAVELGVREPLAEAGLGKAQVRALAAHWGLAVADKPSQPCLASRLAVGVTVSRGRLRLVERAELTARGVLAEYRVPVRDLRVRLLGQRFRVELDDAAHRMVATDTGLRAALLHRVAQAGFDDGGVDDGGAVGDVAPYRSGSVGH